MDTQRDAVAQLVIDAVVSTFRVKDPAPIGAATTAQDVDGWDSLSHTMLLMKIEELLGCELPLERVYSAENVGDLIAIAAAARAAAR
ncbi:MAG: acyl carrier protein [Candidatus Velthaea sp.]|jgi:acyl carrier protein